METELQLFPSLPGSETCFACRGCCIFDRSDSPWIPYFNEAEINRATKAGVAPSSFPSRRGSRIIPVPHGNSVRCPALDPATHACTIYERRPLDCQIYPFILMWDPPKQKILLALHEACPFVQGTSLPEALVQRATDLTRELQTAPMIEMILANPGLIMTPQEHSIRITTLNPLTHALKKPAGSKPASANLVSFLPDHYPLFEKYRACRPSELAHNAFTPHLIWSDLLEYRWAILADCFCLFATSHKVTHMAIPPLGGGSIESAVTSAFKIITHLNPPHVPPRIDNVDEDTAKLLEKAGYAVRPTSPDYIYKRDDIVKLSGNRFRSQRAAANQAGRIRPTLRPFTPHDRDACLSIFDQWVLDAKEETERMMREDARFAHEAAMKKGSELGLIGCVVCINKKIAGYTFGYWLAKDQFCILFEITDRTIRGLAAWLFREFCRETEGAVWINAMDDSSLSRLSRAKMLWHPARLIPSYTVTASTAPSP